MSDDPTALSKRDALESLLANGDVLLQLDPRREGVDVPPGLRAQSLLVLRVGLNMPLPIGDLTISHGGIRATLSFSRSPYLVEIPWQAVFGMVSEAGEGLLWTQDVPVEVLEQMLEIQGRLQRSQGEDSRGASSRIAVPRLVALDGGRSGPPLRPPSAEGSEAPSLRLVR